MTFANNSHIYLPNSLGKTCFVSKLYMLNSYVVLRRVKNDVVSFETTNRTLFIANVIQ